MNFELCHTCWSVLESSNFTVKLVGTTVKLVGTTVKVAGTTVKLFGWF